jgi:hypothetical protein
LRRRIFAEAGEWSGLSRDGFLPAIYTGDFPFIWRFSGQFCIAKVGDHPFAQSIITRYFDARRAVAEIRIRNHGWMFVLD